jgi:hypothetical protein
MNREPFFLNLPVELTDDEVFEHGARVASLMKTIEDLEEEKASNASAYAQRIKMARLHMKATATELRTGVAYRDVRCTDAVPADSREVVTVRLDTGEVVARRPASDSELQREMPLATGVATGAVEADRERLALEDLALPEPERDPDQAYKDRRAEQEAEPPFSVPEEGGALKGVDTDL